MKPDVFGKPGIEQGRVEDQVSGGMGQIMQDLLGQWEPFGLFSERWEAIGKYQAEA